jgi:UDP-GlcNAc3NAcA epimerase
MIEGLERVLLELHPDWVLIYGDTNSTLAGALAAKKLHLRLAHVEAGLRSFNMGMPEEQNRLVADRLSDLLFCPTKTAVSNLAAEGIGSSQYGEKVVHVGDVMYDAALFYSTAAESSSTILQALDLTDQGYALATVHRAENTDNADNLHQIFSALRNISKDLTVVLPLHPRTRKKLEQKRIETGGITTIDPVSYLDMIMLEKHCRLILTDSGGIQKEAFFFKNPCLTLREETEWVELVQAGVNILVGADQKIILQGFKRIQSATLDFSHSFYGEGTAGIKIIENMP